MTNQELLQKKIEEASIYYQLRNGPICIGGDSFADDIRMFNRNQSFIDGANFVLANLWISVDEDLPEFTEKEGCAQISEPVLIKCANGAITRAQHFEIGGEVPAEGWNCIDAGFGVGGDKVTHWMPIPALPKGGDQ